jgi:hypothetical protein
MQAPQRITIAIALVVGIAGASRVVRARDEPIGVIVALPGVDAAAAFEKAQAIGDARWTLERLSPATDRLPADLVQSLRSARQAYTEADFLGCLEQLRQREAELDQSLRRGGPAAREAAGRATFLAAVCAHGAGDLDSARYALQQLFVQGLEMDRAFARTRPDFDQLAEEIRTEVLAQPRVRLTVVTHPPGARLVVDGTPSTCNQTPCSLRLLPGEHLIAAQRLGRGSRAVRRQVDTDDRLTLALRSPSPGESKAALRQALLQRNINPGATQFAQAAIAAFGAQIGLISWKSRTGTHAVLFDRRETKLYGRVTASGVNATATAVTSALQEWRRANSSPFYARPIFYVPVAVAAAAATAVAIYFAARPSADERTIVFP